VAPRLRHLCFRNSSVRRFKAAVQGPMSPVPGPSSPVLFKHTVAAHCVCHHLGAVGELLGCRSRMRSHCAHFARNTTPDSMHHCRIIQTSGRTTCNRAFALRLHPGTGLRGLHSPRDPHRRLRQHGLRTLGLAGACTLAGCCVHAVHGLCAWRLVGQ
jgi:hypothetical protein